METSIVIAKILSLYLLIISAAMLFNRQLFLKMAKDMLKSTPVLNLSGIMALIVGIILVVFHNVWVSNWRVVVTLVAWLSLIKGAMRLFVPRWSDGYIKVVQKPVGYYTLMSISALIGLYLGYYGFFTSIPKGWF